VADKLTAAAAAAGLTEAERKSIDALSKSIAVHRELSNLPQNVASQAYNSKTPAQQNALTNVAGKEDPATKPKSGWFSTAWHYSGGAVIGALTEASDLMTRLYRTGAIALDQGVPLAGVGGAWDIANDKGDNVFSPGRIESARKKFGDANINVAMRIAKGEKLSDIIANGTQEEKLVASSAAQKKDNGLFQDALDAVQASKYSPGRAIANILLPGQLEGSGFFYKAISGTVDAAYRILADPTLVAGKAKRAYDVSKYALDVVVGAGKVDQVFAKPAVVNFWNQYGAQLNNLRIAQDTGKTVDALAARNQLKALAPEFGPAVINSFIRTADNAVPITDALSAKAFFGNAQQLDEIMKGAIGRKRILMPKLDLARQARIKTVTSANKVFNLDRIGPKFVDDYFFGGAATNDGIQKMLVDGQEKIVEQVLAKAKPKGVARFSMAMTQYRIDRFKAKFEQIPFFTNNALDVTAADAGQKVYSLARLVLPQRESKLIAEAFNATESVAKRKEIFYGMQSTIADIRGINTTKEGQQIGAAISGKVKPVHAARDVNGKNPSVLDNKESVALILSDISNYVTTLSVKDLDRAAARSGLIQRTLGVAHSDWVEKMTSAWSFLTLAGPRYAARNATEDLLVHLAIGESPWGLVKGRGFSTRLRTARGLEAGLTRAQKTAANPLGAVMRFVNKSEAARYAKQIDEAGNSLVKIREITATALAEGKLARFNKRLGLSKITDKDREYLAAQIRNGDLDNALADVVEGGKQTFTGIDAYTRTLSFGRKNKVRTAELNMVMPSNFKRAKGAPGFKEMIPTTADEATLVAWLMRIGYYSNDKLGRIAVANLASDAAGESAAVGKIFNWLNDPENAKLVAAFRMEQNGITKEEHAQRIYDAAKQLFVKRDGTLNQTLLSKVRTMDSETGQMVISGKLGMDDLPIVDTDMPAYLVGPQLVPVSDGGDYAASLMEWGWDWLGNANARLSREPMVLAEMIKIRKQFDKTGFEKAFIASHLKGIDPANAAGIKKATTFAQKKIAEIVEDRARLQILAYVDNPMVQSQFAFSIRNFARFYRATEDFYRRVYRTVRYNPESLARAALTYEGITHSGWVQKDDQGDDYFVYPGTEHVYRVVQGVMQAFGVPAEFKTPLPIQFSAKIKMITPSLNPDSMIPTLAGPLSGFSIKVISNMVGIFNPGAADTITGALLGKYAVDQPMVSAFLPAHVNRIYSAMNKDERDGQYASAARKAMTYLEAAGEGIPRKLNADGTVIPPTAGELEAYRLKLKNTTMSILGLRVVYGFTAIASPQVTLKSDMADWVRENGQANFKQTWYGLLDKYNDYDTAMAEWVKLFPNQMPFTISESDRTTVSPFKYAQESGDFVGSNEALFAKYKQGATFLIPQKGGFSWDAYKTMTDMGLRQNKRVEDFLREVQTAADMQTYFDRKNQYETSLEAVGTDFERSQLRKEFNDWATIFKAGRPLVQEELAQGGKKAIDRINALNDLNAMLNDKSVKAAPETRKALKKMTDLYTQYKKEKDQFDAIGGSANLAQWNKDDTIVKMRELSKFNENTINAYNVLFGRLLGD